VVQGTVDNIDDAKKAAETAETYSPKGQTPINETKLAGSNQVNIRVRFAEISRNDMKSFGIDWNLAVNTGNFSFGLQKATTQLNPNLGVGASGSHFSVNAVIEALRTNGALTILAEPNLTAVTGETASFLAGGEVPVPVPGTGQNSSGTTVIYKPYGVSLAFTPTLITGSRIGLKVRPEVSVIAGTANFGVQGFSMPAFTVRRAETTVEMASGQTFAIAGLFQREISRNIEKTPLLGDMPVLGPLFRSKRFQRRETELVILITPYLVKPVQNADGLKTPLDRETEPARQPKYNGNHAARQDRTTRARTSRTSSPKNGSSGFIMR
jgi:pilus assembly protein CpaC